MSESRSYGVATFGASHRRRGSKAVGAGERTLVAPNQRTTDNEAIGRVSAIPLQRHQARASR